MVVRTENLLFSHEGSLSHPSSTRLMSGRPTHRHFVWMGEVGWIQEK